MGRVSKMHLSPREVVILAEDYDALVAWYVDVLRFRVVRRFKDGYRYCNLETDSGLRIGIAPASEADVTPGDRSRNTVRLQVAVSDVKGFFEHLRSADTSITFGPSYDGSGGFWFGGFADPEGNPIWVVDKNCP